MKRKNLKYLIGIVILFCFLNCDYNIFDPVEIIINCQPDESKIFEPGDSILINIEAISTLSKIVEVSFKIKGEFSDSLLYSMNEKISNIEYLFYTENLKEDYYIFVVEGENEDGAKNSKEIKIKLNENPECEIVSPRDSSLFHITAEPVIIDINANDTDRISMVKLYIDDVHITDLSKSPYSYSWDISTYSSGYHTIKIKAVDNNGFDNEDEILTKLNELPSCKIVLPEDSLVANIGDIISIKVEAFDSKHGKDISSIVLSVGDNNIGIFNSAQFDYQLNTIDYAKGFYSIIATAIDNYGGINEDEKIIYLDKYINIPDSKLENRIREVINKPTGQLFLSDVDTLKHFEAIGLGISNITGLHYFHELEYLDFGFYSYSSQNDIIDLYPLIDLNKMTYLDLSGNRINDLTPLSNMNNLEFLKISQNNISDISAIKEFDKLKHLYLSWNNITNISILQNLVGLISLDIGLNDISDISAIRNMKELAYLDIGDNQISNISYLSNCLKLEYFWGANNEIVDISCLTNLTELNYIALFDNQITNINSISNLTNLEDLWINNNKIIDITPITNLLNLDYVNLYSNEISDIYPLVLNNGIGDDDYVTVRENPLNSTSINVYIKDLEERGVRIEW